MTDFSWSSTCVPRISGQMKHQPTAGMHVNVLLLCLYMISEGKHWKKPTFSRELGEINLLLFSPLSFPPKKDTFRTLEFEIVTELTKNKNKNQSSYIVFNIDRFGLYAYSS